MSMSKSRRVQILVEDEQYERLEQEAERRGGSVAAVVREAIDRLLPGDTAMTLTEAADVLLEATPVELDDWEVMKEDLVGSTDEHPDSASA